MAAHRSAQLKLSLPLNFSECRRALYLIGALFVKLFLRLEQYLKVNVAQRILVMCCTAKTINFTDGGDEKKRDDRSRKSSSHGFKYGKVMYRRQENKELIDHQAF